jgi:hypothetical protein
MIIQTILWFMPSHCSWGIHPAQLIVVALFVELPALRRWRRGGGRVIGNLEDFEVPNAA